MAKRKAKKKKSTRRVGADGCQRVTICGKRRVICRYRTGKRRGQIKSNKAA